MSTLSRHREGLVRLLSGALQRRSVQYGLGAIVLTNMLLLLGLALTEQLRWLPVPWPPGITRVLFQVFFATSVVCAVAFVPASVWAAVYLFRRRGADPEADAVTILRRAVVIPATYLLSTLWGWAWLAGRSPRLFGASLLGLFIAHQVVLIVYFTEQRTRQSRAANRARAKRNGAGRGGLLRAMRSRLASRTLHLRLWLWRRWWELTHWGYMVRLSPLNRALFQSAVRGVPHNVEVFLRRGADPNLRLLYGTPLVGLCAGSGRLEVVRLLLDAGADVNAAYPSTGLNALLNASSDGNAALAGLLLERGANPESRIRGGATSLMLAARNGHDEVLRLLLAGGANINAINERGATALMLAVIHDHTDTVRTLLTWGADVTARSVSGRTALDFARNRHHDDAAALLRRAAGEAAPYETTE